MPIRILHIVRDLSLGGGCRAIFALARYSTGQGDFIHSVAPLSPNNDPKAIQLAESSGVSVVTSGGIEQTIGLIDQYDIIQVSWWNDPLMSFFLAHKLPPCRLLLWAHVAGHAPPQVITPELVEFSDVFAGAGPYTLLLPHIQAAVSNGKEAVMILGCADLSRVQPARPHGGGTFRIGYIGTVEYNKMNPRYVDLCEKINIPNAEFIVCGAGGALEHLRARAIRSPIGDRIKLLGYVGEIGPVLSSFDVYGYPLRGTTYAAGELNLQEVMRAGVVPVSFPYGGIRELIIDGVTGLLPRTEEEFAEAIEYLYHNPAERLRMGENARKYSHLHFGGEAAARVANATYRTMMVHPKRDRLPILDQTEHPLGISLFLQGLGSFSTPFKHSLDFENDAVQGFEAELRIARSDELMAFGGIRNYLGGFPQEAYLHIWSGLSLMFRNRSMAITHFAEALKAGGSHWRIWWYLSLLLTKAEFNELRGNNFIPPVPPELSILLRELEAIYRIELDIVTADPLAAVF
jgi:glycosyltransferase involved in cell wall biosynthesis